MTPNQNNTSNPTYSYAPPAQPNITYTGQPRKRNWWAYLLGCAVIFVLIACICFVPVFLIANIGSRSGDYVSGEDSNNIEQRTIVETGDRSALQMSKIAVINISGAITYSVPGERPQVGATSSNIIAQIQKAKKDDSVKAVVLRLNTPGGEVSAAEPICREIRALNSRKPVYAFIDSVGASLGYLLPNCASYIYSRPSAITGSIGVIVEAVDWYGVLEKIGGKVVFITNTQGTQKSGRDIYAEGSDTYKTYQEILDETYEYFVNAVYQGRKTTHPELTVNDIKQYANGRIFSGKQAKDVKLVDELGEFDEVISSIINRESGSFSGKKVDVIEYNIISNPFAELFGNLQTTLNSANLKEKPTTSQVRLLMQTGVVPIDN